MDIETSFPALNIEKPNFNNRQAETISFSKNHSKEGKKMRKKVHELIVEIEKLMNSLDKIFRPENSKTILLDNRSKSSEEVPQSPSSAPNDNELLKEQMDMIMSAYCQIMKKYLQLPYLLKPLFDSMKNYESLLEQSMLNVKDNEYFNSLFLDSQQQNHNLNETNRALESKIQDYMVSFKELSTQKLDIDRKYNMIYE